MIFQNPPYMASRQLLIPRIAAAATSLSPQAWHGYMVTGTHRVEVKVCADGLACAPHAGAAAAPLAGAQMQHNYHMLGANAFPRRGLPNEGHRHLMHCLCALSSTPLH
jgi:hypothetical protein